jgi:hypothetical protein
VDAVDVGLKFGSVFAILCGFHSNISKSANCRTTTVRSGFSVS